MALSEGSDRFQTWLEPWRMDLDPALTAYAFNITNKDEVLRGKFFFRKPKPVCIHDDDQGRREG